VYQPKLTYKSPHSLALQYVRPNANVLDLGCAGGYMARVLHEEKNCSVTGVDAFPTDATGMTSFLLHDLNSGPPPVPVETFDHILLLDVVEHLVQPERFLEQLRQALALNPEAELILSTGNVGFFVTRLMLLAGQFNYGKRGILDLTHTRLFTFASLRRALEQSGFVITEIGGVPGPFPLALGDNFFARSLTRINSALIFLSRGLFSYQIMVRARALPTLETLLDRAEVHSAFRLGLLELGSNLGVSQPVTKTTHPAESGGVHTPAAPVPHENRDARVK
jgi:SAM-dependent methyltransferase